MTSPMASTALAIVALAGILALIVLLARALRASGLAPAARGGRLRVVETLPLDARRRLVLLRCDGRDALVLLGGAQDCSLGWLPAGAGQEPPCDGR